MKASYSKIKEITIKLSNGDIINFKKEGDLTYLLVHIDGSGLWMEGREKDIKISHHFPPTGYMAVEMEMEK